MNVYNDQNQEPSTPCFQSDPLDVDLAFDDATPWRNLAVTWQRWLLTQIQQGLRSLPEQGKIGLAVIAALLIFMVISAIIRLIVALIGLAVVGVLLLVLYQFLRRSQVIDR